ncbi:MAG: hypothetical protein HQL46_15115 [Gammaproteobacteria bacterium]|nr:hypothetical protein [Gammaproteobacteria bacterium]
MKQILIIVILSIVSCNTSASPVNVAEGEYIATGYSAPGQSKYAAFTAAKVDAQRQLLEQIYQTQVKSIRYLSDDKSHVKTIVKGFLKNAVIVDKVYDNFTKTASVTLKITLPKSPQKKPNKINSTSFNQ